MTYYRYELLSYRTPTNLEETKQTAPNIKKVEDKGQQTRLDNLFTATFEINKKKFPGLLGNFYRYLEKEIGLPEDAFICKGGTANRHILDGEDLAPGSDIDICIRFPSGKPIPHPDYYMVQFCKLYKIDYVFDFSNHGSGEDGAYVNFDFGDILDISFSSRPYDPQWRSNHDCREVTKSGKIHFPAHFHSYQELIDALALASTGTPETKLSTLSNSTCAYFPDLFTQGCIETNAFCNTLFDKEFQLFKKIGADAYKDWSDNLFNSYLPGHIKNNPDACLTLLLEKALLSCGVIHSAIKDEFYDQRNEFLKTQWRSLYPQLKELREKNKNNLIKQLPVNKLTESLNESTESLIELHFFLLSHASFYSPDRSSRFLQIQMKEDKVYLRNSSNKDTFPTGKKRETLCLLIPKTQILFKSIVQADSFKSFFSPIPSEKELISYKGGPSESEKVTYLIKNLSKSLVLNTQYLGITELIAEGSAQELLTSWSVLFTEWGSQIKTVEDRSAYLHGLRRLIMLSKALDESSKIPEFEKMVSLYHKILLAELLQRRTDLAIFKIPGIPLEETVGQLLSAAELLKRDPAVLKKSLLALTPYLTKAHQKALMPLSDFFIKHSNPEELAELKTLTALLKLQPCVPTETIDTDKKTVNSTQLERQLQEDANAQKILGFLQLSMKKMDSFDPKQWEDFELLFNYCLARDEAVHRKAPGIWAELIEHFYTHDKFEEAQSLWLDALDKKRIDFDSPQSMKFLEELSKAKQSLSDIQQPNIKLEEIVGRLLTYAKRLKKDPTTLKKCLLLLTPYLTQDHQKLLLPLWDIFLKHANPEDQEELNTLVALLKLLPCAPIETIDSAKMITSTQLERQLQEDANALKVLGFLQLNMKKMDAFDPKQWADFELLFAYCLARHEAVHKKAPYIWAQLIEHYCYHGKFKEAQSLWLDALDKKWIDFDSSESMQTLEVLRKAQQSLSTKLLPKLKEDIIKVLHKKPLNSTRLENLLHYWLLITKNNEVSIKESENGAAIDLQILADSASSLAKINLDNLLVFESLLEYIPSTNLLQEKEKLHGTLLCKWMTSAKGSSFKDTSTAWQIYKKCALVDAQTVAQINHAFVHLLLQCGSPGTDLIIEILSDMKKSTSWTFEDKKLLIDCLRSAIKNKQIAFAEKLSNLAIQLSMASDLELKKLLSVEEVEKLITTNLGFTKNDGPANVMAYFLLSLALSYPFKELSNPQDLKLLFAKLGKTEQEALHIPYVAMLTSLSIFTKDDTRFLDGNLIQKMGFQRLLQLFGNDLDKLIDVVLSNAKSEELDSQLIKQILNAAFKAPEGKIKKPKNILKLFSKLNKEEQRSPTLLKDYWPFLMHNCIFTSECFALLNEDLLPKLGTKLLYECLTFAIAQGQAKSIELLVTYIYNENPGSYPYDFSKKLISYATSSLKTRRQNKPKAVPDALYWKAIVIAILCDQKISNDEVSAIMAEIKQVHDKNCDEYFSNGTLIPWIIVAVSLKDYIKKLRSQPSPVIQKTISNTTYFSPKGKDSFLMDEILNLGFKVEPLKKAEPDEIAIIDDKLQLIFCWVLKKDNEFAVTSFLNIIKKEIFTWDKEILEYAMENKYFHTWLQENILALKPGYQEAFVFRLLKSQQETGDIKLDQSPLAKKITTPVMQSYCQALELYYIIHTDIQKTLSDKERSKQLKIFLDIFSTIEHHSNDDLKEIRHELLMQGVLTYFQDSLFEQDLNVLANYLLASPAPGSDISTLQACLPCCALYKKDANKTLLLFKEKLIDGRDIPVIAKGDLVSLALDSPIESTASRFLVEHFDFEHMKKRLLSAEDLSKFLEISFFYDKAWINSLNKNNFLTHLTKLKGDETFLCQYIHMVLPIILNMDDKNTETVKAILLSSCNEMAKSNAPLAMINKFMTDHTKFITNNMIVTSLKPGVKAKLFTCLHEVIQELRKKDHKGFRSVAGTVSMSVANEMKEHLKLNPQSYESAIMPTFLRLYNVGDKIPLEEVKSFFDFACSYLVSSNSPKDIDVCNVLLGMSPISEESGKTLQSLIDKLTEAYHNCKDESGLCSSMKEAFQLNVQLFRKKSSKLSSIKEPLSQDLLNSLIKSITQFLDSEITRWRCSSVNINSWLYFLKSNDLRSKYNQDLEFSRKLALTAVKDLVAQSKQEETVGIINAFFYIYQLTMSYYLWKALPENEKEKQLDLLQKICSLNSQYLLFGDFGRIYSEISSWFLFNKNDSKSAENYIEILFGKQKDNPTFIKTSSLDELFVAASISKDQKHREFASFLLKKIESKMKEEDRTSLSISILHKLAKNSITDKALIFNVMKTVLTSTTNIKHTNKEAQKKLNEELSSFFTTFPRFKELQPKTKK